MELHNCLLSRKDTGLRRLYDRSSQSSNPDIPDITVQSSRLSSTFPKKNPTAHSKGLSRLSPADIQALEARLLEGGKSARSVQHIHAVLRESLKHALRWGLVFRNPAEAVDPPRSSRPEIQPPSADAVWDILEAAKETPYHGALVFLAFTGCRRRDYTTSDTSTQRYFFNKEQTLK